MNFFLGKPWPLQRVSDQRPRRPRCGQLLQLHGQCGRPLGGRQGDSHQGAEGVLAL